MSDNEKRSVGGFLFYTEKDAQIAEAELKKIEYLESRIDYSKPEGILLVYDKTIHERIFRTPVGLQYLKGLRDFLLNQSQINPDDVQDIPLYCIYGGQLREQGRPARNRLKSGADEGERAKAGMIISVALNLLLVSAVTAMFFIALKSDNPNVMNYERALTDKYAAWEQELTGREQEIRDKERELQMENGFRNQE